MQQSTKSKVAPSPPAARPSFSYRPEIDGLRAIAVLAVLFCHAGLGFSGGYVGVDVFFVISGYLITSLLIRDLEAGKFSLVHFWERRIRRIVPALAATLLVTLVLGWFLLFSGDLVRLAKSTLAVVGMASNLYFRTQSGYFDGAAKERPLLHTWSLSVEEQFYLILPVGLFLFYFCMKRRGWRRGLLPMLLLAAAASLLMSIWAVRADKLVGAYYLLPSRAWEMLMGSVLACLPAVAAPTSRWAREASSWAGVGMILIASWVYTEATPFPGLAAIPPCLGAALIIWGNTPSREGGATTFCSRVLASKPMLGIGLISYSLYLWHWPLYAFGRYLGVDQLGLRVALVPLSFLLAILCWKYVEQPVREKRIFGSRRSLFTFFFCSTAFFVLAGLSLIYWNGVPQRLKGSLAFNDQIISREEARLRAFNEAKDGLGLTERVEELAKKHTYPEIGLRGAPPTVFVWGDSQGMVIAPLMDALLKEANLGGQVAAFGGIPPLLRIDGMSRPGSQVVSEIVLQYIEQHPTIKDVLLTAWWSARMEHRPEVFSSGFQETIERLQKSGRTVWLLKETPNSEFNIPRKVAHSGFSSDRSWRLTVSDYRAKTREVERVFVKYPAVRFIDPLPAFMIPGSQELRVEVDGISLYSDHLHLTKEGAEQLLLPTLKAALLPALRGE